MRYGLPEKTIEKFLSIFSHCADIEEVILYGSRAKGNFKTGSDIDLTLRGKTLTLKILNSIEMQLDELMLPYTFDLSIYHQIKDPALLDHIVRVGVVLYKRDGGNQH